MIQMIKKATVILGISALALGCAMLGGESVSAETLDAKYVGKWEGLEGESESCYIHYEFFADGSFYYENGTATEIYKTDQGTCEFLENDTIFHYISEDGTEDWYQVEFRPEYGDCMEFYYSNGAYFTTLLKRESYASVGTGYYDNLTIEAVDEQLSLWENVIGVGIEDVGILLGTPIEEGDGYKLYSDGGVFNCEGTIRVLFDERGTVTMLFWGTTDSYNAPGGEGWDVAAEIFTTTMFGRYGDNPEDISRKGWIIYAWTDLDFDLDLVNLSYNPNTEIGVQIQGGNGLF